MENNLLTEIQIKVRDYECDIQGIVNNANYQHYYEMARHEYLEKLGLNFYELHTKGVDLVLVSITVKYMSSLKGGDLFICTVDSCKKDGVRYIFQQSIIRKTDNKVCSKASAEVVSVVNGRLGLPTVLDEAISKYGK